MNRPSGAVLAAFAAVVLIGGTNFVAVRFSNRELPPFWGAGLRFALAGALLVGFARWRRIPLPIGSALLGVALLGVLNFGVSYAFAYWGLLQAPAAMAATFVALVPLMTFFMATALRMERFRWSGVIGGAIAVAGVVVVFVDQLSATVPLPALAALFVQAVAVAVSTVLLKRLPRADPIGTNAVAMLCGSALLLVIAFVARETPTLPTRPEVWIAFLYLVTLGGIGLFIGVVFIVLRWTASASAYVTVLFPVVTVAVGAILAGELVSLQFVAGAVLVMLGTYVGAFVAAAPGPGKVARPNLLSDASSQGST
ncbi:MAG TPA: EamA family transporter [Verrucomicrobiae bacterium]|nr:EamA family transporter [Verrucomicrobiae bacterium]